MKLLGLVLVLALALTACNQTDATKNQLKDNNINKTNVSDNANKGKGQAIGKEYGHGKETAYGQVKKIEPGQAVPPLIEAPVDAETQLEKFTEEALGRQVNKVEYVTDYWSGGDAILIHFEDYSPEYITDWTNYQKVGSKAQELYGSKFKEMSYSVTDTENILMIYYY
jgi:hypothetical protein